MKIERVVKVLTECGVAIFMLSLYYLFAAREYDAAMTLNVWGKTPEIAGCPNGRGVCLDSYFHVLHNDEFKEEGKSTNLFP